MIVPEPEIQERARRQVVGLIGVIYWLLILEGAIRKWILPEHQTLLYFVRDPFVIIAYLLASHYRLWPRNSGPLFGATALALSFLALAGVQLVLVPDLPWKLALYGWRNYFLYVPLAFLAGEVLRPADLEAIVRRTLLVAVPIAALVVVQAMSSPTAAINIGTAEDPQNRFPNLGVGGMVRTQGTFTSSVGQSLFVAGALAMLLWAWVAPGVEGRPGGATLVAGSVAVVTCLSVSGSRGAFVHSLLVALAALIAPFIARRREFGERGVVVLATLVVLTMALAATAFDTAFDAFMERAAELARQDAWYSFGIVRRTFDDFAHFGETAATTPVLGYGMGMGGNARQRIGLDVPVNAEADWSRHVVDAGPLLGSAYVLFRILLVLWLGHQVLRCAVTAGDPRPMLLFGFVWIVLLFGQVTGHGTCNGFAWMFAGFCIAACREKPCA